MACGPCVLISAAGLCPVLKIATPEDQNRLPGRAKAEGLGTGLGVGVGLACG